MWIVMTACAAMPQSCKGRYRRVVLVQLNQHFAAHGLRPAMISERARGVLRIVDMGKHNVGVTDRCAYARRLAEAERRAYELNNLPTSDASELLTTWGGSA